ncbi:putative anti-sigma factor antagonist BtrV [bioreactor metagenome]|uniref:Putative anti-sigma factor antagonist BtrV n=1 Tax=bioreactor metagenome TaxID=1076179 RepID=A0A645F5S5_9ZZZZ
MTITKTLDGAELTVALTGRLDTNTAPQLEAELKTALGGVSSLTLEFGELDYISSAGLRVLLSAQKLMSRQGKLVIRHVNESIMEVFTVTGFIDILTIEREGYQES